MSSEIKLNRISKATLLNIWLVHGTVHYMNIYIHFLQSNSDRLGGPDLYLSSCHGLEAGWCKFQSVQQAGFKRKTNRAMQVNQNQNGGQNFQKKKKKWTEKTKQKYLLE